MWSSSPSKQLSGRHDPNIDHGIHEYLERFAETFDLKAEQLQSDYEATKRSGVKPTEAALAVLRKEIPKIPPSRRAPSLRKPREGGFDPLFRYGLNWDPEIRDFAAIVTAMLHPKEPEEG
jgi:hypothetical protein